MGYWEGSLARWSYEAQHETQTAWLALGRSFGSGDRHEIALRAKHFSNGGVREPNPGLNFVQLRYSFRLE
jgi:hypothetical protein